MSGFSFNFNIECDGSDCCNDDNKGVALDLSSSLTSLVVSLPLVDLDVKIIECPSVLINNYRNFIDQQKKCSSNVISLLNNTYTLHKASVYKCESGLDHQFDIIPGKYEGGFKVWECSIDLVQYLIKSINTTDTLQATSTSNVLELGCGHGFPGIACLSKGFCNVLFSDLNEEVLTETTWPNIILNLNNRSDTCNLDSISIDALSHIQCYSGDWIKLSANLNDNVNGCSYRSGSKFDLIVSAETLYSKESCMKILYMIINHLNINGIVLIASKKYYFGVEGGTAEIEKLINQLYSSSLSFTVVEVYDDGVSNIREIIQIQWKK